MPFEKRIGYITPAFPGGHRAAQKTPDQIEQDQILRAEDAVLEGLVSSLRELTRFEGWDHYTGQLEVIEKQITEELVQSQSNSDYLRGFIMGLRKAVHLPAELARRQNERRE